VVKNVKKTLVILCLTLITASLLGSCAQTADNTSGVGTGTTADTSAETTTAGYEVDLPDANMQGKVFNFYAQNWFSYMPLAITDLYAEELNGDALNDAVYERNLQMEQKFNCTVTFITDEDWNNGFNMVTRSVMAGDNTYDLVLLRAQQYNALLLSNSFIELTDLPYVNFDNPWWDQNSFRDLAIKDRKYIVVSDITMNNYLTIYSIFFNKNMINDYNLEDPYKLMDDGTWVLDTFFDMGKAVSADLDGNDVYDTTDRYGFTYIGDDPEGLINASGVKLATLNSEGIPVMTALDERSVSVMQHIMDLLSDKTVSLNCHQRSTQAFIDETHMFMERHALFSLGAIYYAPEMRAMEDDFGIVPYPKYDTQQADYYAPMMGSVITYTAVPITNPDLDNTGIFMEYYAYLGHNVLRPAFYDKLLQGKVARDEESSEVLDYLFDNRFYDTGMILNFGGIRGEINGMYGRLDGNFASKFTSIEEKINNNIAELIEQMS
jgi:hypothetical protein